MCFHANTWSTEFILSNYLQSWKLPWTQELFECVEGHLHWNTILCHVNITPVECQGTFEWWWVWQKTFTDRFEQGTIITDKPWSLDYLLLTSQKVGDSSCKNECVAYFQCPQPLPELNFPELNFPEINHLKGRFLFQSYQTKPNEQTRSMALLSFVCHEYHYVVHLAMGNSMWCRNHLFICLSTVLQSTTALQTIMTFTEWIKADRRKSSGTDVL